MNLGESPAAPKGFVTPDSQPIRGWLAGVPRWSRRLDQTATDRSGLFSNAVQPVEPLMVATRKLVRW